MTVSAWVSGALSPVPSATSLASFLLATALFRVPRARVTRIDSPSTIAQYRPYHPDGLEIKVPVRFLGIGGAPFVGSIFNGHS
ncbi:MAG: hypothetical protein GY854_01170 [Deltaproteobacteria bacterium]|nr:hypothetical protein [Deltaproteobacteria bacterium]